MKIQYGDSIQVGGSDQDGDIHVTAYTDDGTVHLFLTGKQAIKLAKKLRKTAHT